MANVAMPKVTMPTSAKHALLLDTAMHRAITGSQREAFLRRLERSLDQYGSLTPAMVEACSRTITERSN
jgi:hypothetical protein